MTRLRLALFTGLLVLGACSGQEARDGLWRSVEGLARSACDGAGNCTNSCPDGSSAPPPAYRCLRAD